MENLQWEDIRFELTTTAELEFVLATEAAEENIRFVTVWPREKHEEVIQSEDMYHFLVKDSQQASVGYVILAGRQNPHQSIELLRVVITEKGKGYGRKTLRLVKRLAFEQLSAHRLWLDVKEHNDRAQQLYRSEGFVAEGTLRDCVKIGDRYESLIIMSILAPEYRGRRETS
jgi:diamine N-acetyltransferase